MGAREFARFLGVFLLVVNCIDFSCGTLPGDSKKIWNETETDKLRQALLTGYDVRSRPTEFYNQTVCNVSVTILNVAVDEKRSTMELYGWLALTWYDDKLKWNPNDYKGLAVLRLGYDEVWKPDLYVYNSPVAGPVAEASTNALLYPTGKVLWVPPTRFTILCDFDYKYWPFDTQDCSMKIGSWTNSDQQIDLNVGMESADLSYLSKNGTWEVKSAKLKKTLRYYPCCKEAYPDITLNITMTRRSTIYSNIIIAPAFAVVTTTLLSFWIPPHQNGKILINGFTAVIICLFLLYFAKKLPLVGSTPLIVSFYTGSLILVTVSFIEAALVIWLATANHSGPMPRFVKNILTGTICSLITCRINLSGNKQKNLIKTEKPDEIVDHQVTICEKQNGLGGIHFTQLDDYSSDAKKEWCLFADVVDKFFFIGYVIVFAILTIYHTT